MNTNKKGRYAVPYSAAWLAHGWESASLLSGKSRVRTRRKCCLCNDICKRLDFLVFSDKDENRRPRLTQHLQWFLWDVKETRPLFEKSRGRRPRCCGEPSHTISHHSHHGLGGYSKLTNGLRAAASGAFVC